VSLARDTFGTLLAAPRRSERAADGPLAGSYVPAMLSRRTLQAAPSPAPAARCRRRALARDGRAFFPLGRVLNDRQSDSKIGCGLMRLNLIRSIFILAVVMLSHGGQAFAKGPPPCADIASASAIKRILGYSEIRLIVPGFQQGGRARLLVCRYLLHGGSGGRAVVTYTLTEDYNLPIDIYQTGFVNFGPDRPGRPLYGLPTYGAEKAAGYMTNPDRAVGGWWSLSIGREIEIEVEIIHGRSPRPYVTKLGALAAPRDVVREPLS
jgi:hypothetical protein